MRHFKIFLIFVSIALLVLFLHSNLAYGKQKEKIGVLYSYKNVASYEKNGIIGFDAAWKRFLETFSETYLDSQFLCNISKDTKAADLGVNILLFPLAIDINNEEARILKDLLRSGKKVVILGGIGNPSEDFKKFLIEQGILFQRNEIAESAFNLKHKSGINIELPIGSFYSIFNLSRFDGKVAARWAEINQIAIGAKNNLVYVGYSWGQDVDKDSDIQLLLKTLNFYFANLTSRIQKEITKNDYEKIVKECVDLRNEASSVIQTVQELGLSVPVHILKKHFQKGDDLLNDFNSNYLFANFLEAREKADLSKNEFAIVLSLAVPSRDVEVRAIWLDRETIINTKGEFGLRRLIKKLAKLGFNVIFFETVNAGYPIYPSKILEKNPLVRAWDPLKIAIDEAHKNKIELHGWVWTFAVGNTRHNLLIGKEASYRGPVLTTVGKNWALTSKDGLLRISGQPEMWVSPANIEARDFLINVFSEIVKNYDVDGLQLDYVRFPFQDVGTHVGYDLPSQEAFRLFSGRRPEEDGEDDREWIDWKTKQVNIFIKDLNYKLKQMKPKLKLSAAVFAIPREQRISNIQQDWETWVLNGWINIVYPFYYSFSTNEVEEKLKETKDIIGNKGVIIPGFNLRVLNEGELAERIIASRNGGALGVALFATAHLDKKKKELLSSGPFKKPAFLIPYNDPLLATRKLYDEFFNLVQGLLNVSSKPVLSDDATKQAVWNLANEIKKELTNHKPGKNNDIEKKIDQLQIKIKEWLSLEKYLNRNQRMIYINSYLDQIRTLLGLNFH